MRERPPSASAAAPPAAAPGQGLRRVLGRLGLLGRLVAILFLCLLSLAAVGVGLSYAARERGLAEGRIALPEQLAAVVALLDRAPADLAPAVARAVGTPEFALRLRPEMPAAVPGARRMPAAEWVLAQALEDPDRAVLAQRMPARGRLLRWLLGRRAPGVEVAVALADGRAAVFTVSRIGAQRLFGVPVGFWIGAVGCLFAALATWAIAREARPLRRLGESLAAFGADGRPRPVPSRGAPEIRRLIQAVNAMQARIAGLLQGRTVLLGAVGHDLKTFITRLRLRIEDIEDPARRARAEADLEAMTRLVDDALAVARGAEAARRARIDLRSLAEEELAARAGAALRLHTEGPVPVLGEAVALRRMLSNLLDNALRYGTRAEIRLSAGEAAELVVDDDGPGIPEESREAVFEPFLRLEASRSRETGGSGLGLAIVRQIVEAHGGTVAVGESPLGGAALVVRLPLAEG